MVNLLQRKSALWIPKSLEEFREANFLELLNPKQIDLGIWTGIERFNLTHFQFNNQPFIPKNYLFATKNIFHPIVTGIHLKSFKQIKIVKRPRENIYEGNKERIDACDKSLFPLKDQVSLINMSTCPQKETDFNNFCLKNVPSEDRFYK